MRRLSFILHVFSSLQVEPGTWSAEDQLKALRMRIPDLDDAGFGNLLQLYLQVPSIWPQVGC